MRGYVDQIFIIYIGSQKYSGLFRKFVSPLLAAVTDLGFCLLRMDSLDSPLEASVRGIWLT
jgi:hypothetical protein